MERSPSVVNCEHYENCKVCGVSSTDWRRIGKGIVCRACADCYNEVRTLVLEAGRDPATYQ
ncbi:hypothetical protein LCGC14_1128750 [marine sediment metagenome]|uniref:ClpX-type ZB domain-containing protein n=1 Tax=marine sediment metagenome TaxID=412755 RepID=A0A0F9M6J5_9ZZZZ